MDDDVNQQPAVAEESAVPSDKNKSGTAATASRKQKGLLSRVWNGIFRKGNEDFEKKLQHLTKEEASIHARMKRRTQRWRKTARNVIVVSVVFEVVAVAYAIMTTRSVTLNWKMRATRVLPMFALPFLSFLVYSTLKSYTSMRERKDQKTLERLRAERQAKIDELKERTNYYITQQLIQRYDPDPAAKAAAASVLASKLGAESGLKVHLGDEYHANTPVGRSSDVELVQSRGLRNRKQSLSKSSSTASSEMQQLVEETPRHSGVGYDNLAVVVEHHPKSANNDGGWIARIAALLVGEDPTQCYALICGNCHMHNGLARKEDFPYITYYCPHCNALNGSQQVVAEHGSGSNSGKPSSPISASVDSDRGSNSGKPSFPISASVDSDSTTIASGATSEAGVPETTSKGNELQDSSAPNELKDSIAPAS